MTMIPWFRRGLAYAKRSINIRRELGDVWGEGQSLNFYGVVLYASSRYRECIEACDESIRLLRRTGDRWEQNTATWHQIFSHYRLGELEEAVERSERTLRFSLSHRRHHGGWHQLEWLARAGAGRYPENFISTELDRDLGDAHTRTEVLLADGVRYSSKETWKGRLDVSSRLGLWSTRQDCAKNT